MPANELTSRHAVARQRLLNEVELNFSIHGDTPKKTCETAVRRLVHDPLAPRLGRADMHQPAALRH
jgi:hypothetical protein